MKEVPLQISVVIPTYNRPAQLERCLRALAAQDLTAHEFEVLVVDDGSRELLDGVIAQVDRAVDVRLFRQENLGPAAARNLGAEAARGRYLAFTDDDCEPDPKWLRMMLTRLSDNPRALIGGYTINSLTSNVYSSTSQMLVDFLYERYQGRGGATLLFTSNNIGVARAEFRAVGGFARACRAAEDREFSHRWHESGLPALFVKEALVYHGHALSLRSFWRQHFTYGRGAFQFRSVLLATGQRPVKIEPLSFYRDLLLYPWKAKGGKRRLSCMGLMGLSQAANAAGFAFEGLAGVRRTRAERKRAQAPAPGAADDATRSERAPARTTSTHPAASDDTVAPTA